MGNSCGFTNVQSTHGGAFSGDLLDEESKSSLFHVVARGVGMEGKSRQKSHF